MEMQVECMTSFTLLGASAEVYTSKLRGNATSLMLMNRLVPNQLHMRNGGRDFDIEEAYKIQYPCNIHQN